MKIVPTLTASALTLGAFLVPAVAEADPPRTNSSTARAEPNSQQDTAAITGDLSDDKDISDRLFGVFYEDINHAADGGLYAELVRNRSFEFSDADNEEFDAFTGWETTGGEFGISDTNPIHENNPNFLRTELSSDQPVIVRNSGFNQGMHLRADETYDFAVFARHDGNTPVNGTVRLTDANGQIEVGTGRFSIESDGWTKYEVSVTAEQAVTDGRLELHLQGTPGTSVDVDMVSLFPTDTFQGRENGLRTDLAQRIADLEPSFFRFPGGCLVNTGSFDPFPERERAYDWKDTVGPIEQRPTNHNTWGYNQSYGLGYYEYFQFAEDLGAEPLPVVPVGVTGCGHEATITDPDELQRWVDDTLDLIEFANGGPDTEWGSVRAEMGHPEPFGLKSIALGNEEYDEQFLENYPAFHDAIRDAYPEIEIVSNSGTESEGEVFERNWEFAREQGADLVDEHYYNSPSWFLSNTDRYDDYDREGPHVFIGEYASQGNAFSNALAEAAYLTGVQRNGDVVELASYAPLLANTDYVDWEPDAIWFDNHRSFGSANYWVQQMFSTQAGDQVIASELDAADSDQVEPLYQVVTRDSETGDVVLKVVNARDVAVDTTVDLDGQQLSSTGTVTTMTAEPDAENTFENPDAVRPESEQVDGVGNSFEHRFEPHSVTFIRLSPT